MVGAATTEDSHLIELGVCMFDAACSLYTCSRTRAVLTVLAGRRLPDLLYMRPKSCANAAQIVHLEH